MIIISNALLLKITFYSNNKSIINGSTIYCFNDFTLVKVVQKEKTIRLCSVGGEAETNVG